MIFDFRNYKNFTDDELVARYKKTGKPSLVGILYERFYHLVYGVCLKYLKDRDACKDMVIAIFEKLLISLKTEEISNFKSWLYKVTKNECLMYLRSEQRRKNREENYMSDFTDFSSEHDDIFDLYGIDSEFLSENIKSLKPEQQLAIIQFYYENKSYAEISKINGITVTQVKSYIQNGKRNLFNLLANKHENIVK